MHLKRILITGVIIILALACIVEGALLTSVERSGKEAKKTDIDVSTDDSELTKNTEVIQRDEETWYTFDEYRKVYMNSINERVIDMIPLSTESNEFDTELNGSVYVFNDHTGMLVANYKVDKYAWGGIIIRFPEYINLLNGVTDYIDNDTGILKDHYIEVLGSTISSEGEKYDALHKICIDSRGLYNGYLEAEGPGAEGTLVVTFEIEDEGFADGQVLMSASIPAGSVEGLVECILNLDGDE